MTICTEIICSGCGKKERVEFGEDDAIPSACSKCTNPSPDSNPNTEPFDSVAPQSMEDFEGFGYT